MSPSQKPRYKKDYCCFTRSQNGLLREVGEDVIKIIAFERYCLKFVCWVPVKGSDCGYSCNQHICF